jgi:hypothetical protein
LRPDAESDDEAGLARDPLSDFTPAVATCVELLDWEVAELVVVCAETV